MARASTKTMLSLDRFAAIVGIHPLHFNQVELPNLEGNAQICGLPILQYSWQNADRVGREEVAQAIAMAEDYICHNLGFKLLPTWEQDEITTPRGRYTPLRTRWKYVISGGVEGKSLIDDNVAITYSDSDSDGYEETATISFTTTVTDPDEIAVFYPDVDGDDAYEIRPITVAIDTDADLATVVCRREQLVILSAQEDMLDTRSVDGQDDSKFLTVVDVYRRYNDPSNMGSLISFSGGCCASGCSACQYTSSAVCLSVANARNGIVNISPGTWDEEDTTYIHANLCALVSKADLRYRAGASDARSKVKLKPEWERAVAYYALSFLDRPLCRCNSLSAFSDYWRQDIAKREFGFNASQALLNCPLGTTRGAINAWRLIQRDAVGESLADFVSR